MLNGYPPEYAVLKGYGAKIGLENMRVKAENRMLTEYLLNRQLAKCNAAYEN